jgi:hypothetical protein
VAACMQSLHMAWLWMCDAHCTATHAAILSRSPARQTLASPTYSYVLASPNTLSTKPSPLNLRARFSSTSASQVHTHHHDDCGHHSAAPHRPQVTRFKAIPKPERFGVGEMLGKRLRALFEGDPGGPAVAWVEKPYAAGFTAGFGGEGNRALPAGAAAAPPPPFVLLLTSGGDEPATHEMCAELARSLPTMRACFATNLHRSPDPQRFRPLPLGVLGSEAGHWKALAGAQPWSERDQRLLVTPMAATNRLRTSYQDVLSRPEYSDLVVVVQGRRSQHEFLELVAQHRAVVSPPGRGYDCHRTWQVRGRWRWS